MSDYTNLLKEMLEALKEFFSYTHQDAQKVADVINKTLDDIAEAKGINREELYDCVTRQAQNAKEGDAR